MDVGWRPTTASLFKAIVVRVAHQVVRGICWAVSAARRSQVSVKGESRESDTP